MFNNPQALQQLMIAGGLLDGSMSMGQAGQGLLGIQNAARQGQQFAQQQKLMNMKIQEIERERKERERQRSVWDDYIGQRGQFSSPAMGSQAEFEAFDKPNYIPDVGGGLLMDKAPTGMYAQNPQMAETLGLLGQEKGADFLSQVTLQGMKPVNPKDHLLEVDGKVLNTLTGEWIVPPGGMSPVDFKDLMSARKLASDELDPIREGVNNVHKLGSLLDASNNSVNPMADYAAMISFIKSLDPTSVVREGEVSMANSALSAIDRLETVWEKTKEGGFVNAETRNAMRQAGNELMKFYEDLYRRRSENLTSLTSQYSMRPEDVTGYAPNFGLLQMPPKQSPPQPPPKPETVPYTGPLGGGDNGL